MGSIQLNIAKPLSTYAWGDREQLPALSPIGALDGQVPMSHVGSKKWSCCPVEFKKTSCSHEAGIMSENTLIKNRACLYRFMRDFNQFYSPKKSCISSQVISCDLYN